MRIIAGSHKGRALAAPKGTRTRPTAGRTRESIFNKLAHASWSDGIEGKRVLDLFAGSGALGFEAMSRGAAFCLFVETDTGARGALRENVETLQLSGTTSIYRRDAAAMGPKPAGLGAPFDLVFLDPPYGKGLGERALVGLIEGGWLSPEAIAVLEVGIDEMPDTPGWERLDEGEHGAARVVYLRRG
ncbi:MAG: 16S rRNA (guanine(966)-N(2))-methyltransferase RsmD [Oceanicaulis sp. HLUCCA04]|nr:MAG: 16S rRNA (guanine(966)-N(2))-methyltransferase RsmD [Oceanicaulis sp. HLUCCA04]